MYAYMYNLECRYLVDAMSVMERGLILPREAKMVLVTEPIEERYYASQCVRNTVDHYCYSPRPSAAQ
jgi:hypothetical protein